MNSKQKSILLLNGLIVLSVVIIVLIFEAFLSKFIDHVVLKYIVLILIALMFYFIFAFHTILKNDKLQEMVENTLHELNTPIATIKANVLMLKKSIQNEKNRLRLMRIEQASNNLVALYEKIEYKIKKEIDFIELSDFDVKDVVDESILKFEDIKGDIKIINQLQNYIITTDKIGFSLVIDNLLSNAIKYNKKDGFVKIYLENDKLVIEDSGKGIDTKNLFIIFERYYQYDSSVNGFGVGLYMVKEFCDRYKIDIKIDSKEKVGTKFSLDLSKISLKS